jgi:tetratricopeptide (TPR) repeat protein
MPSILSAPPTSINVREALGESGAQEYHRLLGVVEAAAGMFALMPIACDLPNAVRDDLLETLQGDLAGRGISLAVARLDRDHWDSFEALSCLTPAAPGTSVAVALVGLEETPGTIPEPGAPQRRSPAFATLNHQREAIRSRFPFPLLVFCDPATHTRLQEDAPDFFDHFLALFEFAVPRKTEPLPERSVQPELQPVDADTPPGSEAAVAFYEKQLAVGSIGDERHAHNLLRLAESLLALARHKDATEETSGLSRALVAAQEALEILSAKPLPRELGRAYALKGGILSRQRDQAGASASYELALNYFDERTFPADRAWVLVHLGFARFWQKSGRRATNLGNTIECYEAALRIYTERESPKAWAQTQAWLGDAYRLLETGNLAENLRRAIACYEAALRVFTERDFPEDWARNQNNLGIAYDNLPTGDRAENTRQAIAYYEAALRVYTERDFPEGWAWTQSHLGIAYLGLGIAYPSLPAPGGVANLRQFIACCEAALRVYTERDFPVDWAWTQRSLGTAYLNLPAGDPAGNLRQVIACYEAALRVYTERDFPADWAWTQRSLGTAYSTASVGDRGENLRQAVRFFEDSIRGYRAEGLENAAQEALELLERTKKELEELSVSPEISPQ